MLEEKKRRDGNDEGRESANALGPWFMEIHIFAISRESLAYVRGFLNHRIHKKFKANIEASTKVRIIEFSQWHDLLWNVQIIMPEQKRGN